MSATSFFFGHEIVFDGLAWVYADDKASIPEVSKRSCPECNRLPSKEGHDPCLGYIDGAISACCGHGKTAPILIVVAS